MRYKESKSASAEILRMIIPEMARHDASYHPVNYAIWYENIAGINPALKQAMEEQLALGNKFNDDALTTLFQKHIQERDEIHNKQIQEALQRLIGEVKVLVQDSSSQADQYTGSLEKFQTQLDGAADQEVLKNVVQSLLQETRMMRMRMSELREQLTERANEVNSLRGALNQALGEAMIDPLTGLLNRRGFNQVVEAQAVPNTHTASAPPCLILADIDHFKKINDTYGHLFGDKVICGLGEVLCAGVQQWGTVARFGGEEFAILLNPTQTAKACAVAENLRANIEKTPFRRNERELVQVTISMGVADYFADESVEQWINRADMALYASKRSGRNKVTLFREDLNAQARQ